MKKQLTFLVLLALLGAFVFSLEGCGDKCEGSKRTSAEFKVYSELNYYDKENGKTVEKTKVVEEDTLMVGSYVTFEALDANATSYEWTIGSDPRRRTEKKVTLLFNDESVAAENPITIKLKLKRNPNTKCFPDDRGIDSLSKRIYFLERAQWPLYGNYLGSDDTNPTEKYRIKIFRGIKNGFYTADSLTNLPNNCTKLPLSIANRTAFEFVINRTEVILDGKLYPTPNCYFFEEDKHIGYLKLDRRTIVIEYEFTDKTLAQASLQKRTFTGIKQN